MSHGVSKIMKISENNVMASIAGKASENKWQHQRQRINGVMSSAWQQIS